MSLYKSHSPGPEYSEVYWWQYDWVNKVQKCCQHCRSAAFQIEQHSCWQAMGTDCPPLPLQSLLGQRKSEAILRQQTYPTARPAILSAILSEKTLIFARAERFIGQTPWEACCIPNGVADYTPIFSLLALECNCRCKTAPTWVLCQLDQSGLGAHCIQGVATSLGLLLLGRAQLSDHEKWTVTTHRNTQKQIKTKAAE